MVHAVIDAGLYPLLDEKNLMMSMYPILTISRHQNPAHLGKNLYAYATELKKDPLDLVMDLFAEDCDMGADMAMPSAVESNDILCTHRMAMPCSDGFTGDKSMNFGLNEDIQMTPNPMNYSFIIRYLTRYQNQITLEELIHNVTMKPAVRFGIEKRGSLQVGNYADIVIFDREALHSYDRDANMSQYPEGIEYVLVNGVVTIDHKRHTQAAAGRMLRKNQQ